MLRSTLNANDDRGCFKQLVKGPSPIRHASGHSGRRELSQSAGGLVAKSARERPSIEYQNSVVGQFELGLYLGDQLRHLVVNGLDFRD
jgi:hypothetical protein